MIRPARSDDPPDLPEIERRAGAQFAGYETLGAADPGSVAWFREAQERGLLWVAADASDRPVAFALFETLEGGDLHLEEIDVDPDHARQSLGARLIDAAAVWARERGHAGITLTTFRDVPWNAPYYERLGFRELPREAWTKPVSERVAQEARNGLDPARRVVMRRPIGGER